MTPLRIFLIDDSRLFRVCAATMLASCGGLKVVGEAGSAAEGFEKIESAAPDLVLMDLSMPQMNGIEATKRIKARPNAPRVAIVTLHDDPLFRAVSMAAGADWFVIKDNFADWIVNLIAQLKIAQVDEDVIGFAGPLSPSEMHQPLPNRPPVMERE
jgi:DNA-binding NarL/FixJ family response regulator